MSGVQNTKVGTCQATEQKPGSEWVRFLIEVPGNQYPIRADTRDADVIAKANAVGGQIATWTINEVESSKINPRNNKPYINRYLEDVVLGGTPVSNGSGGVTAGSKEEVDWDSKERRDYRSRSWAHTFSAWAHTIKPDDDPILIFEKLKPFQRKLYADIVRELIEEENSGPAPVDDDIPF